jgi:LPXTG-site transpeptidase (sortase) family protein
MRLWRVNLSRRVLLLLAPLASGLLGAALVVLVAGGVFGGGEPEEEAVVAPTATAAPRPTLVPAAPPSEAPATRLVIPEIDVDAPLDAEAIQADGVMPTPLDPELVAYYDMSAYHPGSEHRVGFGGNAVFAGHVDYIDYGPAVFWDLDELEPGDEVQVLLDDGTVYRYAVVWNQKWPVEEVPWWDEVFEVNGRDAVTLITCAGSWDGRKYSDERAVRAERVYGPFPSEAG